MAFLCISLDRSSTNAVHLLDGELSEIDKFTSKFNDATSILKEFRDKVKYFKKIYNIDDSTSIALCIFLPDDKERFVLYKKHLVAFKALILNNEFLKYALAYESNLLDKEYKHMIESDEYDHQLFVPKIKNLLNSLNEDKYYDLVRRLCYQYENYLEDIDDDNILTVDQIYDIYLERKNKKIENTGEIPKLEQKISTQRNPFVLFKHPKFLSKYGTSLDKNKPIFILGGLDTDNAKYSELISNCSICFDNKLLHKLNANVSVAFNENAYKIYDNSLLVLIYGNILTEDIDAKIKRAIDKEITVLILTENSKYKELYEKKYANFDTIIIRDYKFGDYDSKKAFADIAAGLYINEYNKRN